MSWTVVIPVKPAEVGKSRLGQTPAVALAIALDTIAAAVGTGERVIVVTADASVAWEASALGASVVAETEPAGLDAAIAAGLPADDVDRAVLLGDLPALRSVDLASALADAARHPRAFVPDAEGTGTTLVTATAGSAFIHHFGASSAELHRAAGLAELPVPADSTLRRDVDLAEHLVGLEGLGPRTLAALAAAAAAAPEPQERSPTAPQN